MAHARFVAGLAAGRKLAAGRRAPFINTACGLLAHRAGQRRAARLGVVRAAHAAGVVIDFVRQPCRHAPPVDFRFIDRKINAKTGAAGAAGEAGVGHG